MKSLFSVEDDSQMNDIFGFDKVINKPMVYEDRIDRPIEQPVEEAPKKRRRKKESVYKYEVDEDPKELQQYQSNEPYSKTYKETQDLLKDTIAQINDLSRTVDAHLNKLNSSPSVRNYKYITDLTNTQAALINSKISAIREMNTSITSSNRLDITRAKDLNMADKKDDDKYIMDLYNALINTPINNGNGLARLGPGMIDSTIRSDTRDYIPYGDDSGYNDYMSNMSPEQNRMFMEGDPNIKTVVIYNQATGEKKFDVVDTRTNKSVPNMPIPDRSFLDDMTISFKSMTAKNTNTNISYPLIVVGDDPMTQY